MFELECPYCLQMCEIKAEDLPDRVCDEKTYDCQHCEEEMKIGWRAEVEVRSVTVSQGDLLDYEAEHGA